MKSFFRILLAVALLGVVNVGSAYARNGASFGDDFFRSDDNPTGEAIIFDAVILRPAGLISMAVGFAGTIAAAPFTYSSQSGDRVYRGLVQEPYDYTFCRPLGDLNR